MPNVIIIGISSDIGSFLAHKYLARGDLVWGTYRTWTPVVERLAAAGAVVSESDVGDAARMGAFARKLKAETGGWDRFISAVGLLDPIGLFFDLDMDAWERSIIVNSTSQLRCLHALYPARSAEVKPARAILFAGGGTNGPFDNYSAYCLGKIVLIKACELLHSECSDLVMSILGTGWVNTRIHAQSLKAGKAAGLNLDRTLDFMEHADSKGTSLDTIADCFDWCFSAPRTAVGGRNFSIVHDGWRDDGFASALEAHPDAGKLRRRWDLTDQ